ncbi:MAG: efflux RND transporter permease subunit, partial [Phycisphaeraceae bacterium]
MNYIRFAINNPVKVAVGVLLLLLFGILALLAIPIQLTPNVDQPIITVETTWIGRSPQEIEREIVEEQEDKLKGLTNLKKMTATAQQNAGSITLEFYIGTDMTRALQEVSDSLREVPDYPEDVDEPVISASDSSSGAENAIAWLIITSSDPDYNVQRLGDVAEDRIKPLLERVEGISEVQVYGGRERQVHILIDPAELAQRGITFNQLASALQMRNVNVSAGEVQSGRLDVRVRTVGQYDQLDQIRDTIVTYTEGGPVRIADLGEVELTLEKERSFVRSSGREALALPVTRETGSNVMAVMDQLQERIDQINAEVLPDVDPSLTLEQVYDETTYIEDAISLVTSNLFIGGSFAVLVLLLYLRTIRPTVVVAVSIPVSIIGTFVVMTALGRNLNVISLAGLAFAVGMVVDAAIVVLENIDRHLAMGKRPAKAALDGASEVWGAILASALTTLCVFIPVIFMQEEAGQLFRDISIAICAAVALSLIVSVTVIPTASSRFLKTHTKKEEGSVMHAAHTLLG